MLCTYCHDNEHSRSLEAEWQTGREEAGGQGPAATHNPFADLKKRLGS
jgi:hypothetical protein